MGKGGCVEVAEGPPSHPGSPRPTGAGLRVYKLAKSVYRFIGVWQQDSGKGPRFGDGAAYCVPDLTPHAPALESIAGSCLRATPCIKKTPQK